LSTPIVAAIPSLTICRSSRKSDEARVAGACKAVRSQKRYSLKISREYGVSYEVLRGRVRRGKEARTAQQPVNKALKVYQEKALKLFVVRMCDWNMPVTPGILQE
jgi:hypothetical protein